MTHKRPKILMLLEASFPPDIRVEKEAKALLEAGFDLSLLCAGDINTQQNGQWRGMKIHRVPLMQDNLSKLRRLIFTIQSEFFSSLKQLLSEEAYDVIHVHDLRLVPTALKIKKIYPRIKVVADLHENYPAGVREWTKLAKGLKGIIFRTFNNYKRWSKIEAEAVQTVDHIIAVVKEMKERMLKAYPSLDENKITVVSNLEDKSFVQESKLDNTIIEAYNNFFTVLYIGGFGMHRGIDTAIKGMKEIDIPNIKLLLVGKGAPEVENYIHQLIHENNLESKVEIVGWQPFEKVLTYQTLADICIVPHNSNEHTNNTIPHKLFQYMMVGKPMLVSSCAPLARVTKEANAGLVFEACDSKDFAQQIIKMYTDRDMMKKFGENGKAYTFIQNNNWQEESKKLIAFYEKMPF